jgi:hypothetical protein
MGMAPIRFAGLASALLILLALSGCYSIKSQSVSQLDVIGDVQIATTICGDTSSGSGTPANGCPISNQPLTLGPGHETSNLLIAYRVPTGAAAPDSFDMPNGPTAIHFTKSQSYTDSLTAVAPPPSGEKWVGYMGDNSTGNVDVTATVTFGLPSGAAGKAFHGPFQYRTVVGFRHASSSGSTDAVECASDPTQQSTPNGNGTWSVCIDSPSSSDWPADQQLATRDLGIAAGDSAVAQNQSGQAAFTADFAGSADPSATFDLSLSSDAPDGVKLTLPSSTFTPATDSTTAIPVDVSVSPDAALGTYSVTLTAQNDDGQKRTATAELVVALGKPANRAIPFVSGTDAVGQTVTCSSGDWSSSPSRFAFQWTRNGTDISGATASTYTPTQDDGATLVACRVVATNAAGDSAPATSGPIRVAQEGGADVDLSGPVKVTKSSNGTYAVDTGITVSCPPRLPQNCGGSNRVTASAATAAARSAATLVIGKQGFASKSGERHKIVLRLTRRGSKLLRQRGRLKLIATVVTRNHKLQRVTSRKQFTAKRP